MTLLQEKLLKLSAVRREGGILGVLKMFGRSFMNSLWDYQSQEVRGRLILDRDPRPFAREVESHTVTPCVVVESAEDLQRYAGEFRLPFRDSFDELGRRLDQGCILMLARRATETGSREIVGYSIMERGGFSAAGIKGKIWPDILFVHFTEVANKYRGQRIAQVITRARNEYCRRNDIRKSCTAHTTGNDPSEWAFRRFGSRVLCYAVRVSLLRGLIVWHTPWRKIERAIEKLDQNSNSEFEVQNPTLRDKSRSRLRFSKDNLDL